MGAPPIVWTVHGLAARTAPTTVTCFDSDGARVSEHEVPSDTLAIGLGAEGLVTTNGFVVRRGDHETRVLDSINRWREPRVVARCAFSEDARLVAVTWQSGGEWRAYDAVDVLDVATAAPVMPALALPDGLPLADEWCDGEVALAGGFAVFGCRTEWIGTEWGSQGGPSRRFLVWSLETRRVLGWSFEHGDVRDVGPIALAIDRAGAFVARACVGEAERFDLAASRFDVELAVGRGTPGSIAVDRRGTLVVACSDRIVEPGDYVGIEADDPIGIALSPDETRLAWVERSGPVRVRPRGSAAGAGPRTAR